MTGSQNRLIGLTKELVAEWENTKQHWNDAKSQEFEKRFINELTAAVNLAVANLANLEQVISKVRSDCE